MKENICGNKTKSFEPYLLLCKRYRSTCILPSVLCGDYESNKLLYKVRKQIMDENYVFFSNDTGKLGKRNFGSYQESNLRPSDF